MSLQIKIIILCVASIGIAWISRSSLRDIRSHGFYRFFAWEAILALILLNVDHWFYQPFRINQLFSWSLLITSLFLVIPGIQLLHKAGKQDNRRSEPGLYDFEKTSELVTTGIYGYIRHPLYSSLLFLGWGVFFKLPSWVGGVLAGLATLFLWLTARNEEVENIAYFGSAYQDYMHKTRMFIPFLF
ncbi:MAG: isoprenylcysteine carboxylmethyltransferase family protein [Anaerolineales bacterium]|nr:MAG: isoprenylcysteine carboxylmethyltransferase family protein [Anaerolineales bacterium]